MPISTDSAGRAAWHAACARTLAARADFTLNEGAAAQRGLADAAACQARFALPDAAWALRPPGRAGDLFDVLVEARSDALGARWLPGVAANLVCRPTASARAVLRQGCFLALYQGAGETAAWPTRVAVLRACLDTPLEFARQAAALGCHWAEAAPAPDALPETLQRMPSPSAGEHDAEAGAETNDRTQNDAQCESEAFAPCDDGLPGVAAPALPEALSQGYRIFSTHADREVLARELVSPAEAVRLRALLDGELQPYRRLAAHWAHRLQRLLLTRQRRYWRRDQEEGRIDPSRLARLVADPGQVNLFCNEEESPFPRTAVTLLLDNSGSMRGRPIHIAALTADLLTQALERCGIRVEVLGYTTAHWQGGPVEQAWQAAGSPPAPGRLNALRHIVYKPMDQPWRRARRSFGVMLQDGLLKENIDGEALAWACQRLLRRPEPRRLLIVLSDGAPMDQSTLAANPRHYLEEHLHQVVAWAEKQPGLMLRAIGIGHPVARYYRHALSVRSVDELATALFGSLRDWLT